MHFFKLTKLLFITFVLLLSCKNKDNNAILNKGLKEKKPNVVYILTDQWRGSALGYAGNPDVKTPNLDKFAQQAVNFTNTVSVTPVCTPHRAALLTGRFPTTTGMFLNDIHLPAQEFTMAEIYKTAGYKTAYWGKWHLDGHGRSTYIPKERRQGFDFWRALECSHNYTRMPYYDNENTKIKRWNKYSPFAIAQDANIYITAHAKDKKPFLAFISIATPHYPHTSAPKKYKAMYPSEQLTLNPNVADKFKARSRKELQGYYAHATATDEAIGQILDNLKIQGLLDNTIIVFSADHGEMMGAHGVKPFVKQLAWDESLRVPFLISYPGIAKNKGAVVNAPITTPDILPSLLGLSNISIPESIEGENLAALIKKPDPTVDRAALVMNVAPFGSNNKDAAYRAIRTKQYTYSITTNGPNMLFDNIKDPYQQHNLLGKDSMKNIQENLDKQLKGKLKKIRDSMRPKSYYLNKYNYKLDKKRHAIDWWSFDKGEGIVQSPKPLHYNY